MIKIAITGGIGSGKSYVSSIFESFDVPIYNADENSKKIVSSSIEIKDRLIDILGDECYKGGILNKKLLADFIFSSDCNRLLVNSIIHPYVYMDFLKWSKEHYYSNIIGMESAILFESGFDKYVDRVVMVYAPLELRIERAMTRDNASQDEIKARISAQMDDEKKRHLSHYVIDNSGDVELIPQVKKVIEQLLKEFRE